MAEGDPAHAAQGAAGASCIQLADARAAPKQPDALLAPRPKRTSQAQAELRALPSAAEMETQGKEDKGNIDIEIDLSASLKRLSLGSLRTLLQLYCVRNSLVCRFEMSASPKTVSSASSFHAPPFAADVLVQGKVLGRSVGNSQHASQMAAITQALVRLQLEASAHNYWPLEDFIAEFSAIKARVDFGGPEASLLLRHHCKELGQRLAELIRWDVSR